MKTIKELRVERGISLRRAAEILEGMGRGKKHNFANLHKMEAGNNSPTVGKLADVLTAIGYELELYARDGDTLIPLHVPRAKDARI